MNAVRSHGDRRAPDGQGATVAASVQMRADPVGILLQGHQLGIGSDRLGAQPFADVWTGVADYPGRFGGSPSMRHESMSEVRATLRSTV